MKLIHFYLNVFSIARQKNAKKKKKTAMIINDMIRKNVLH